MERLDELKLEITSKRTALKSVLNKGTVEEVKSATTELERLMNEYKATAALEASDFEALKKRATPLKSTYFQPTRADSADSEETLRNRAFNKLLFNPLKKRETPLTEEEERAYFNVSGSPGVPGLIESDSSRGGYLVSPEQMKTLQEFRQDYVALKDYVSVVSTNTTSGTWNVLPVQNLVFQPFVEMTDVAESDLTLSQATYTIADHGLIIPISNQLIEDADVDVIGLIGRQLAQAAVRTENQEILKPLNRLIAGDTSTGLAAATTITSYKALNTALFKTLDGVYEPSSKIFVNQDTFLWLANLDDGQNRPLFVPDVVEPNKYRYRGKEIVVLPNAVLGNTTSGNDTFAPIFVGDMRSYLTFFERKGLELSTSREYLWRKHAYAMMGIIRFGIVVTDPNAMLALKVKL